MGDQGDSPGPQGELACLDFFPVPGLGLWLTFRPNLPTVLRQDTMAEPPPPDASVAKMESLDTLVLPLASVVMI